MRGHFCFGLRTVPIVLILFSCAFGQIEYKKVCFKNACIQAEVVDTETERQNGLMFRKRLPAKYGMLFVFEDEAKHAFWMKNMLFPLDIIWLSEEKQVVYIAKDVAPCQKTCEPIAPEKEALYVLELTGGSADKHRIEIGSVARF